MPCRRPRHLLAKELLRFSSVVFLSLRKKHVIVRESPTPMASSASRRRSPSRVEHDWPAASTGTGSAHPCWRSSARRLYSQLQLLTPTFTDFNVEDTLDEPGAIVVAEKVLHVTSANWPPWNHIDFPLQGERRRGAEPRSLRASGAPQPGASICMMGDRYIFRIYCCRVIQPTAAACSSDLRF